MKLLDNLCGKMDVTWVRGQGLGKADMNRYFFSIQTHVNAHVGIPGNEAADALAKAGSLKD